MPELKEVVCADLVRFRVPSAWKPTAEEDGVTLFQPDPADGGSLRVTTAVLRGAQVRTTLMETAVRFVHPNDVRTSDRMIEPLEGDGLLATAYARSDVEGEAAAFYLWLKGRVEGDEALCAMFSYVLPAERDGTEPFAAVLGLLDHEIRTAVLGRTHPGG